MDAAARCAGLRSARLTSFVTVATALAVAGHVAGGGAVPNPAGLSTVAGLALVAGLVLVRRWRGRTEVVSLLAAVQVVQHEVLALHGSASMATADVMPGPMPAPMPGSMSGPMSGVACSGAVMVAAHVVAVLLTGLVLAHGETMLRSLCAAGLRLVSALRMVQRRPLRVWSRPRRPGGPVDGVFVRRRGLVPATRRGRRGPPCPAW